MYIRKALWSVILLAVAAAPSPAQQCNRTVVAKVAALDQVITYNRLGSNTPAAAIFALTSDIVDKTSKKSCADTTCAPGKVELRDDKRPRPIVLRANAGDCLNIVFTNLLDPRGGPETCAKNRGGSNQDQMNTCYAGLHIQGLQLQNSVQAPATMAIQNDASWVGNNPNSLVQPVAS